jgi:hypothetical protein
MADSRLTIRVPADGGMSDGWGEWVLLGQPTAGEDVVLDLTRLLGVGPGTLLRLRAFIEAHSFVGNAVSVIPPETPAVRAYLSMMHLGAELPPSCSCDLGDAPVYRDHNKVLIPVRRLHTPEESDRLDEELEQLLAAQFTGKIGRLAEAFTRTASEMCDNATSHGRSEVVGAYVSAQRYTKQRCILAIGDLGVGIPDHIRKAHPELTADDDAIRVATLEGVTATGLGHRGIGYQWVIDGMKDTKVPLGELRVWSGQGRFRVEVRDGVQIRRRAWPVEDTTAGTWVQLLLAAQ